MVSLYRKKLPYPLVSFASNQGKEIFKSALLEGNMETYFELGEQYVTQARPEDCGVSSLVMVLNALGIDPGKIWKQPWRWFSEELLNCQNRSTQGVLFHEFVRIALCNNTYAMGFYPFVQKGINSMTISDCSLHPHPQIELRYASLDTFRSAVIAASRRSRFHLVVNSSRKALNQTGEGHFSPVAGYHSESDMCLVMDVARFKYPAYWCPVPLLYKAFENTDPDSGNCRGFILLTRSAKHFAKVCTASLDMISLKNLPRPLEVSVLQNPPQDLFPILVYYFFQIYEGFSPEKILTLNQKLNQVETLEVSESLKNFLSEVVPEIPQAYKLILLAFKSCKLDSPLKELVDQLREQLGLSFRVS